MKFILTRILLFILVVFASNVSLAQPGMDPQDMQIYRLADQIKENPNDSTLLVQYAMITESSTLLFNLVSLDKKYNGGIYFQLAENHWHARKIDEVGPFLDSAFAHGYVNLEWYTLKSKLLKEQKSNQQKKFLNECMTLFPREASFKYDKAFLLLSEDSLAKADSTFRESLLYTRETVLFPITYWVEAIYKKDEKLAKEWIDQMNVSVRSMSDVSNAHFYSGYYYYSFFKDYPTAATYFDLWVDDTGFDATAIDYQKINGGNNRCFYYRGVAQYQIGKYQEAYDALFYAFMWSIEPMHFEESVLFKELVKDNPRDERLEYLEVVHELNCWYSTKEVRNSLIKKGIKTIENEITLHPKGTPQYDYAKYYLAFAYHVLGENDDAKKAFDEAEKGQFRPHFRYTLRSKIFEGRG